MTLTIVLLIGLVILILIYPFYKYMLSKAEMLGWLEAFKQIHKKEAKTDGKKKK